MVNLIVAEENPIMDWPMKAKPLPHCHTVQTRRYEPKCTNCSNGLTQAVTMHGYPFCGTICATRWVRRRQSPHWTIAWCYLFHITITTCRLLTAGGIVIIYMLGWFVPWVTKQTAKNWVYPRNILPDNETAEETLKGWNSERSTVECPMSGNNWTPVDSRHKEI